MGRLPNDYNEEYTLRKQCDPITAPSCSPCYRKRYGHNVNFTYTCVTTPDFIEMSNDGNIIVAYTYTFKASSYAV